MLCDVRERARWPSQRAGERPRRSPHPPSPSAEGRSGTGCEAGRCWKRGGRGSSRWSAPRGWVRGQHRVHPPARSTG
eukprot:3191062-Pleurochrysis_carterae.AAC.1